MRMRHTRTHWILVALVLAALLFTLNEAHGQGAGSAAVFEGRPALAGAQGGLGAQAGLPQGGLGVQGREAAERTLRLRRPGGVDEPPQGRRHEETNLAAAPDAAPAVRDDVGTPSDQRLAREDEEHMPTP